MVDTPFDLIFGNLNAFLLFFMFIAGGIGLLSRKLSVAAFGIILVYSHIVINTDVFLFDAVLYLTLIVIILGLAFRTISYMLAEDNPEGM